MALDRRVLAVGLFGSLARRQALPSSDADLLIVLREYPQACWFDRVAEYADAFAETSLPVEPFPYLYDELERMRTQGSMFLRTVLRDLISLGGDPQVWDTLRDEQPQITIPHD